MNSRCVYLARIPYGDDEDILFAVSPFLDARDGRLKFRAHGSGVWQLTGNLSQDTGEAFSFICDDEVMGLRGGTYKFRVLTLEHFRELTKDSPKGWGAYLAEICKDTEDLHFWFRHEWPNELLQEYSMWVAMDNERRGIRTDYENKNRWEKEAARETERAREIARQTNEALESGKRVLCAECSMRGETGYLLSAGGGMYKCSSCGAIWNSKQGRFGLPPAMARAKGKRLNEELRAGLPAECPKCKVLGLGTTGNLFPTTGNPKHILSSDKEDFKKARTFQCDVCAALWDAERLEWIGNYVTVW